MATSKHWHNCYLPYVIVVDIPDTWADDDPRVTGVANRHPADLPSARLAAALAPCHGFMNDTDLTDYGFGGGQWLSLAHASANQAEMELVATGVRVPTVLTIELAKTTARAIGRLPDWAQMLALSVTAIGLYWWQNDGCAMRHISQVSALLR